MHRLAGLVGLTLLVGMAGPACTARTAEPARTAGKWMSIGGVVGLVGTALTARFTGHGQELLLGFSVVSGVGLVTYATAEITQPQVHWKEESEPQKYSRWAKILTERAAGAARDGRCARVRRLEPRVNRYDAAVHDLVFMRDPEILRCLSAPAPASGLYPDATESSPPPVVVPPDLPPIVPPAPAPAPAP